MATVASDGPIHHRNTARIIKQGATPAGDRAKPQTLTVWPRAGQWERGINIRNNGGYAVVFPAIIRPP